MWNIVGHVLFSCIVFCVLKISIAYSVLINAWVDAISERYILGIQHFQQILLTSKNLILVS